MQLYYFSNPIRSFLKIFILIFLTGCGSYQYSSVMTDDVYENNDADDVKREKIIHVHLCVKKFFFYKVI